MPLLGADAEHAQLPGLRVRQERRQRGEHHVDLAADEIVERGRVALVRDVHELDSRNLLEELAAQVQRRAIARRGIGQRT